VNFSKASNQWTLVRNRKLGTIFDVTSELNLLLLQPPIKEDENLAFSLALENAFL
jgi:hypothetical protein